MRSSQYLVLGLISHVRAHGLRLGMASGEMLKRVVRLCAWSALLFGCVQHGIWSSQQYARPGLADGVFAKTIVTSWLKRRPVCMVGCSVYLVVVDI